MNTNVIITVLLALVIVVFIFARQIIQRPVTQRGLLLPLIEVPLTVRERDGEHRE